ncbi:hypothetical protein CALCODRAFT_515588 [Calocera cornea HHB12733]|uniref:Uncharacterized protein n=1 Tax=Calocera cornea HHB12733 TaxID=1353952 RepID=A0A165I7F2_9BASI|nr:hypothetical protein CALCODRAFT_515588 [Calocera cornea HHB12733]
MTSTDSQNDNLKFIKREDLIRIPDSIYCIINVATLKALHDKIEKTTNNQQPTDGQVVVHTRVIPREEEPDESWEVVWDRKEWGYTILNLRTRLYMTSDQLLQWKGRSGIAPEEAGVYLSQKPDRFILARSKQFAAYYIVPANSNGTDKLVAVSVPETKAKAEITTGTSKSDNQWGPPTADTTGDDIPVVLESIHEPEDPKQLWIFAAIPCDNIQ